MSMTPKNHGSKYMDASGRYRTESLFVDRYRDPELRAKYPPIWTYREDDFTDEDGKVYPSLLKIYLSFNDPTEYRFAMATLGSWEHWKRLCESYWFKPLIEIWRETLEVKIRSEGIQKMMENTDYLKAAQWAAEGGWLDKKAKKQKTQTKQQQRIDQEVKDNIDDDASRLGIETRD